MLHCDSVPGYPWEVIYWTLEHNDELDLLHIKGRKIDVMLLRKQEPTSEQMSKQAMAMGGQLMMRAAAAQQTKMGGRPGADRALLPTAAVTLDTFLHDFSVGKLINKLADLEQHNLRAQIAAVSRPQAQPSASQAAAKPPTPAALVAELQVVDKLLVNFQRCAPAPLRLIRGIPLSLMRNRNVAEALRRCVGQCSISHFFCRLSPSGRALGSLLHLHCLPSCSPAGTMKLSCCLGLCRAEKEMGDLEKMVDQKVQALHEKLRGKEEEFQVCH